MDASVGSSEEIDEQRDEFLAREGGESFESCLRVSFLPSRGSREGEVEYDADGWKDARPEASIQVQDVDVRQRTVRWLESLHRIYL